jgi:hypothetical protein
MGYLMPKVSGGRVMWPAGQGLVSYHLKLTVELTHSYKYPPYPPGRKRDQKVRFSFL